MIARFGVANLIPKVDEVGSKAKLSHRAEGDEHEKIWVISRLEGGHLGGERGWCLVGRRKVYEGKLHV